ncbi:MAG: hypothetical protein K2P84_05325 [Undibacterium sp.]|nr:hypothetical protein [Undibacterium sp.]
MRSFSQIFLLLSFIVCSSIAQADTVVCVDAQGKKVFSSESCEKKGMKSSKLDFPVAAGQVMQARVITPAVPVAPVILGEDGKPVKVSQSLTEQTHLEAPVLYFLLTMLVAIFALFTAFFSRYVKIHHGKLRLR